MKKSYLTPLEIYTNLVFKLIVLFIPGMALCAGLTFSVLYFRGFYPDIDIHTIIIFDITCVLYAIIGGTLNIISEDKDGVIKESVLKVGKIIIAVLMGVQWNFISYMIPSRDFWAYSFFFVILSASFLDSKYILGVIGEIVISMVISWIYQPELLPVRDELFVPEMVLRCVLIVLCFSTTVLIIATIERRLTKALEKISDYDTLTLLYNRRKLGKYFENAPQLKERYGHLSVIMIDIDDFKNVNDAYGHACGDEVLKDVAGIMRSQSNGRGIVFRYGGEEMLILVYADEEVAFSFAEEVRKKVEIHTTSYENEEIHVTVTLGIAEYSAKDTFESLIKKADSNLYYGKNHGKNCVVK